MTSRLLLTLLLAVISGELFIPSVAGSENNSVTILSSNSPPKPVETPLFCNCSYTISPLCTRNATCNANSVAQVLRKRAQLMKEIIDKANVFPGDETNNQARDDICHTLRDTEIIDSVLVEYLDE
uniref:Uncharacterized protein n=1 Tax=Plectus sambesii TaxID=2011161 RepID=A0A914XN49_9BILA